MINSKNTLYKWRKEAHTAKQRITTPLDGGEEDKVEWADRILILTQELINIRLLEEKEVANENLV